MNVIGPLISVSAPAGGVIVAKLKSANNAEIEMSAPATRMRIWERPDRDKEYFFMMDSFQDAEMAESYLEESFPTGHGGCFFDCETSSYPR